MIKKQCQNCGNVFLKAKSEVKRTKRHFCSKQCNFEFNKGENHIGFLKELFACAYCDTKFLRTKNRVVRANISTCSKECRNKIHSSNMIGKKNFMWSGGEFISKSGYKFILDVENGYIQEHRYIMQKHLNRTLLDIEVIHHENGDKLDNRIQNLTLMTQSEHAKIHRCNKTNRFVTFVK